jgi:hypothetical protein
MIGRVVRGGDAPRVPTIERELDEFGVRGARCPV